MTICNELRNRMIQCRRLAAIVPNDLMARRLEQLAREYSKDYRAVTGYWPRLPEPWNLPASGSA